MNDNEDILLNGAPGGTGKPFGKPAAQPPGDDKLAAYLEGRLSAAEQHEVEEWMNDEGMESDAIEGLKTLQTAEIKHSVSRINTQLNSNLAKNKRKRRQPKPNQVTWIAILIILLLVVVAYLVIKLIV